ncbi:FtsX-like permease family protein [Cytophagaceae bacterium DM2B3-1]|uniref:FtsX-like permease family protein n=1 Tax=Xanthocytophaga flava TaxID=3048013 RepID=A0ABT7CDX1_9BACT|nr:FtsX-like permease family protein [Xanthocytophaga flavus]MDJ1491924.1 FtsX-like permease family protein [Xanthocytophaga flavus]
MFRWLVQMAWRDSRKSRRRLLLFMSAIVLGIAALVAIQSFSDNLSQSIDDQAKELLGADLSLSSNKPLPDSTRNVFQKLGRKRSEEVGFASMVLFPHNNGTRLVQVKAMSGEFPYYGTIETVPASASKAIQTANERKIRHALVDDALLVQFGVQPGDSVKIGDVTFYIAGRVNKMPGQTAITTTVTPTVYIPYAFLDDTHLLQRGSRVNYRFYYQFNSPAQAEQWAKKEENHLNKSGINFETIEGRKESTGKAFANLTQFLNLVGFVALLLGCVGVASAVHLYIKEKIASVAVLRCLGAKGWQTFLIFLIQTSVMGLLGAIAGAALGSAIQFVLPTVFGDFLPVSVSLSLSWSAIIQGIGIGLLMAVLFALLPLLIIRRISPLRTLRSSYEGDTSSRDPWRWLLYLSILLFVATFSYLQSHNVILAVSFTGGMFLAFTILSLVGYSLMWAVRKFFPTSWSYAWRQGLANLYRPHNQTLVLITSIGLGTFLIATLNLTQTQLLNQVSFTGSGNQPNMVLFDIQPGQKAGVNALVKKYNFPVIQQVPVVTMRLAEIKGKSIESIQKDTSANIPEWALNREYRVTYRDTVIGSEKIASGKLRKVASPTDTIFVSLEEPFAKRLKLKLGDELTFNVQGAIMRTRVGSTREVDWNRVQTNFLVVFPSGVLEQAPQFNVLVTRTPDTHIAARFQQELVTQYPNVSAIDLGLILKTLDEILAKISFVIRFMALFSILTGLLVLASSVIISKYQRIQESVLLRTIGANRRQILLITSIEYLFLGLLAALAGIIMSTASTWALAKFVFETPFVPVYMPLAIVALSVAILTVLIGIFNSREVLSRPPLEVLRAEV